MKNIFNYIYCSILLCSILCILPSCSTDEGDNNQPNTLKINGVEHSSTHIGYLTNDKGITFYFGNGAYGKASKSVQIDTNAESIVENHYFYTKSKEYLNKNVIHSASYKVFENNEETIYNNITEGALSLIQFDRFFIVEYDLKIDGFEIEGYYFGTIASLNTAN